MRCLLLHGFAGTPAVWDDVLAAWQLPDPPRAVALPGHGGGRVQATWDANIEAVATSIGDCAVVIGYSLGARIALGLVAAGHCTRAVLISCHPGIDDADRPARRAADAQWARLLREQGVGAFATAWTEQPLFDSQNRAPADKVAARRARRLAHDAEQLAQSLEVMGLGAMPDYRGAFAEHRGQIALIAGANDPKFSAIANELPCASREVIADCGHDPTLERPHELATAIARAVEALR